MQVREAASSDLNDTLFVERAAFEREEIVQLVADLLADPTAEPTLSLLAFVDGKPVGHILFTAVRVTNSSFKAAILAPLAVVPDHQKKGIGGELIRSGLQRLSESGVELVFVLGHPEYYPRHGFEPAGQLGFEAPYPIPEEHADAWMVQALRPDILGRISGKVVCANALDKPEHWRE
jgi:putative acetyltransferase